MRNVSPRDIYYEMYTENPVENGRPCGYKLNNNKKNSDKIKKRTQETAVHEGTLPNSVLDITYTEYTSGKKLNKATEQQTDVERVQDNSNNEGNTNKE